jgi:hypothetical protein
MVRILKNLKRAAIVGAGLAFCLALPTQSHAQFQMDGRLVGTWIKSGTGDRIEIKPDGDINLLLSGTAAPFSGQGSVERCTTGGANRSAAAMRHEI